MKILSQALKYSFLVAVISGCAGSDSDLKVGGEDLTKADIAINERSANDLDSMALLNNSNLKLNKINFDKKSDTTGIVTLSLSDVSVFELKQTTPTEYVLVIPGAVADASTKDPKVALSGMPGIRTVRVTEAESNVLVRMFVDNGISLLAKSEGKSIVVSAYHISNALDVNTRGQLVDDVNAAEPKEAKKEVKTSASSASGKKGADVPSADGSKVYTGKLISLDLQDTDIDNALKIIAEVSRLNIIASEEVKGKITLRLVDVPWDQALDVILKTNGLDQVSEGSVVRIAPVRKLREEREALVESKKAAQALEELQISYIRVSYARASELVEQVQSVLTERGNVAVDERTNQLIVKDVQEGQKKVAYLVGKLDLRTPQVLLETQIVEGSRDFERSIGNEFHFSKVGKTTSFGQGRAKTEVLNEGDQTITETVIGGALSPIFGGSNGFSFGGSFTNKSGQTLDAMLTALESEGKARVVSRPQIATVNNKPAEIKSVKTVRVMMPTGGTQVVTGANGSAGNNQAFEEVEVGITLKVTPQAAPDYYVLLDIDAKSSTLAPESLGVAGQAPNTIDRTATSTILVESGSTFALGGIYKVDNTDTIRGVPFFKDIPILGQLFRYQGVKSTDEELVFFITPHVVEGSFDEDAMKISK
ncbi:MAG: type IV pilus secretin PilQ [Deltaproteobacteria bacterium]|jgi:type IV pilus assembly protein PilQ|nr:type IV pilus secretin PilQ [Deltaproteobacteria bacterium]